MVNIGDQKAYSQLLRGYETIPKWWGTMFFPEDSS